MSMYHHPDLIGEYAEKPLMEVEEVTSKVTVVFDFSELSLKQNNPGVIGVRKVKRGLWTGTVIAA